MRNEHTNLHDGQKFTGYYKMTDMVVEYESGRIGEITHCFGWNSDVGCYMYIVTFAKDTFSHLYEFTLDDYVQSDQLIVD